MGAVAQLLHGNIKWHKGMDGRGHSDSFAVVLPFSHDMPRHIDFFPGSPELIMLAAGGEDSDFGNLNAFTYPVFLHTLGLSHEFSNKHALARVLLLQGQACVMHSVTCHRGAEHGANLGYEDALHAYVSAGDVDSSSTDICTDWVLSLVGLPPLPRLSELLESSDGKKHDPRALYWAKYFVQKYGMSQQIVEPV
mmetsp:Transcript_11551/g.26808  ORF Transcript_11551/g.26808 Transcript_11551/m.26808 type:complete len:194 (+) Transcript_11551:1202-1783(+)